MMLVILDDIGEVGDADDIGRGCPNLQIRYAFKKKQRHYLGIFPNMGGGSSQIPKLL